MMIIHPSSNKLIWPLINSSSCRDNKHGSRKIHNHVHSIRYILIVIGETEIYTTLLQKHNLPEYNKQL
jgi:hypothetical protein